MLNRVLRICADGLRYEADPRHSELLVRSDPTVPNQRKTFTPGKKWIEDIEHGPEQHEDDATVDHSDATNIDDLK